MFVNWTIAQTATTTAETPAETPAAEGTHTTEAGATHNTETGVPHGAEHGGAFPPFDAHWFPSQILWLVIAFGAFYILISRKIAPSIGAIIENRAAKISGDIAAAQKAKADADAAIDAYEKELAAAKAKAGDIAAKARDEAKAKADQERAQLEASLNDKIAAAEASISEMKTKAMAEVGGIATDTAQVIVQQLTGAKVAKAEATAAVKAVSGK